MQKNRDIILTINGVEPGLVKAIHTHSKELGVDLKGLVLVNKSYATREDRPRDTTGLFEEVICDFENLDEVQRILQPYMDRLRAVTCRFESAVQQFREIIPFLPYIATPSETALVWSTEKHKMRDRLANYDRSLVPKYCYLEEQDIVIIDQLVADFEFPVIVKPAALAASLLVERCENKEELREFLHRTFKIIDAIYEREHRFLTKPTILVEEMIQGDMYSVDAYVTPDGEIFCLPLVKVITAHMLGLPGFYCYRDDIPVDLSDAEVEKAHEAAKASIRALNLSATTTHIELFHTTTGWKIIELGARMGGYREDLYREAYGIDHYYNDLAVRMGLKPKINTIPISHAVALNIYAEEEGVIKAIHGLEESRKLESVVYVQEHAKPGDIALFADAGGKLIVDTILSNPDLEQLEKDIARLEELVKIEVQAVVPAAQPDYQPV